MPPVPSIRRVVPADAPALTALALAAKRHWGYRDHLMELWRPMLTWSPASVAERLAYVAVDPGDGTHLLAAYALSRARPVADLTDFWVSPAAMGRGLGRRMFAHAVATAAASGATALSIESDPHAEGFYLRLGARRVGEVPSDPRGRVLPLLEFRIPAGPVADEV